MQVLPKDGRVSLELAFEKGKHMNIGLLCVNGYFTTRCVHTSKSVYAGVTTNNDPRRIMTGGSLFYVEKWPPVIIRRRKMTPSRRIMSPTCRINTRGVIIQRVGYRKMTPIEKWPPHILLWCQRIRAPLRDHLAVVCLSVCLSVRTFIFGIQDISDGNMYFEHETLTATFSPLARNTFVPPRGNFADLVFLIVHYIRNILSHVCTLAVGAFRIFGVKREKLCKNHWK